MRGLQDVDNIDLLRDFGIHLIGNRPILRLDQMEKRVWQNSTVAR